MGYTCTSLGMNLFAYCENSPVNDEDFTGHYSSKKAIEYAKKWWYINNPDYKFNDGGDCANFVSQCLYAGEYSKMTGVGSSGWHHYRVWAMGKRYFQISNAWGIVKYLKNWISRNTITFTNKKSNNDSNYKDFIKKLSSYSNGKAVIFFMRSDKTEYHNAVISGAYKNDNLYYYGHTDPKNGDGYDYKASLLYVLKKRVKKEDISVNHFKKKYLNDVYYKKIQVMFL